MKLRCRCRRLWSELLAAPARRSSRRAAPMTLNELEQLALQNNPTTTAAAAGIEAARGRTRQAGAWPNPVIGYSGEEIKTRRPIPRGEHGFFVEQTIPLGGKLGLSRNVFRRRSSEREAVRDLQRLRILSSVRQAFYSVLAHRAADRGAGAAGRARVRGCRRDRATVQCRRRGPP